MVNNKINIVGLGPGNIKYISSLGIEYIKNSDIIVGSERQLKDVEILTTGKEIYVLKKLPALIEYLRENSSRKICIIVSGDTGFFSLVPYLSKYFLKSEMNIIPSISSYQYLFSKLGENWQYYRLASIHGRKFNYLEKLDDDSIEGLILLTDDIQNPYEVAKDLYENGKRGLEVIIGENLSYDNEKITIIKVEDYEKLNRKFDMNVLVLKKGENYAYL